MNLSDSKSAGGMFEDNYDDSFFKDGQGNELISDNKSGLKAPEVKKQELDESYNQSLNDDYSDNSSPVKKQPEMEKVIKTVEPVKAVEPVKPLAAAPLSRPSLIAKKEAPRFDYLNYGGSGSEKSDKYSEVEEEKN